MAAKAVEGDYRTDRFIELRAWLREAGCCWNCEDNIAFAQVDRENGTPHLVIDLSDCRNLDNGERCRARANANRKSMPARR